MGKMNLLYSNYKKDYNVNYIFTYDKLKVQEIHTSAGIHRLLTLQGVTHGVKKLTFPQESKVELKGFYNCHKGK